jgi:hypothetical protein
VRQGAPPVGRLESVRPSTEGAQAMPARLLRRLVAVLVCSACLLVPQAASSTPGAESGRGERGSGPATRTRPRRIERQPGRGAERHPLVGRAPHPVGAHRDRLRRRGQRLDARSERRGRRHVRVRTVPAREPQAVRASVVPRVRLDTRAGPGAGVLRSPGGGSACATTTGTNRSTSVPTTRSLARRWPGRCSAPRPSPRGWTIRSRATRT